MRKFESSQKDESRAQLADSSKAYKLFIVITCLVRKLSSVLARFDSRTG